MEKKSLPSSPHGWLVILMIVFSLCVLLLAIVFTSTEPNVHCRPQLSQQLLPPSETTTPPTNASQLIQGTKVLYRKEKTDLIQETLRRYVNALPPQIHTTELKPTNTTATTTKTALSLHGIEISNFSVGKTFYIYDCNIAPSTNHIVVSILMEIPEITIEFKDRPEYNQCCPTINPYIHAVELVYSWGYNKDNLETYNGMKLTNLKIYMVSWEDNLYNKAYQQVKNSPLYKSNVPAPLDLQKEELYDFLKESNLFERIPMVFDPPIKLHSILDKSSTTTTTSPLSK